MEAILFSVFTFFSTFLGGLFSLKYKSKLHLIMSFTAGVVIAVCFFDILPEVFRISQLQHYDITYGLIALVAGFLAIHILEKIVVIHHSHETEYAHHRHPAVGVVSASGLAFHSFLDGVGIGLGFHINPHIGILIAFAVIAHDFSDGLNTVTLMLVNNNSQKKALKFLFLDAATPILGAVSTVLFTIPSHLLIIYLGFFAGFLLYIGASDLLPEAHSEHSSFSMIVLTILGVIFIFGVTRFT